MNKKEFITRRGEAAYVKMLATSAAWRKAHPKRMKAICKAQYEAHKEEIKARYDAHPEGNRARSKKYYEEHPEKVKAHNAEQYMKDGKYYGRFRKWRKQGLEPEKAKIRKQHAYRYRKYKKIIAPGSQIHHEWIPETANYRGVALVEKDAHIHGIINVIKILKGNITLLTELK